MKNLSLITFLLASLIFRLQGQQPADTLRLRELVLSRGQATVSVDYPGFAEASDLSRRFSVDRYSDGRLYMVINHISMGEFLSAGLKFSVEEPEDSKKLIAAESMAKALDWQTYPTYTQYDSIMRKLAADFPSLCILDTIGTSILGKLVLVLKISDNVHVDEPDEPEVFYTSTMHGDELGGYVLMLRLAHYLLHNYSADARVQYLVDNLQIYINPLANPDGTYRNGDIISNPTRANANGKDLNRNFPDPLEPGIVQEKENVDMISFMRGRRFVLSANFHGGAEVLNYPWDRWTRLHPDDSWFVRLCRAYADTVHLWSPALYLNDFNNGVVRGSVWYVIWGGRQDFVTWELQGREVTIELDDMKQTPAGELENLWQYNYRSLLNYISFALHGVTGRVRNAETGEGIRARILAEGHDTDSSHVYSFPESGFYNRLIDGGTRAFRFSSPGFRDTVITGIVVVPGERYSLDVDMKPLSAEDTVHTSVLLVRPNPSAGLFEIVLPENSSGEVLLELISHSGKIVWKSPITYHDYLPYPLDVRPLPSGIYILKATAHSTRRSFFARVVITGAVF